VDRGAHRLLASLAFAAAVRAEPEVLFYQPFQHGEVRRVTCGQGHGSHTDDGNRYAIDYDLPIGTPVVAAADGVVIAVEDRFALPSGQAAHNNQVAIRHADGRVTVYLHLREKGSAVAVGQKVMRGDLIAYSGNTGATSGPHLHFGVQQSLGGASVPFRFADFGGDGVPKYGNDVTSFNFPVRYEKEYREIAASLIFHEIGKQFGCVEVVADRLPATARIDMPMPLDVLKQLLARRDAALREYEEQGARAVEGVKRLRSEGDFGGALRLAHFGARDYAGTKAAPDLDGHLSGLRADERHQQAFESLATERDYRRLIRSAILKEMAVGNVQKEGAAYRPAIWAYEAALKVAPEPFRSNLARHLDNLRERK